MNFALVYIFARAAYRFVEFWRWWYLRVFGAVARFAVHILERLDRSFAVKINFYHLFQPLYQDYTVVGRILGPFFRLVRVAIGFFIYSAIIIVAAAFYIFWALLPFFIIYKAFS